MEAFALLTLLPSIFAIELRGNFFLDLANRAYANEVTLDMNQVEDQFAHMVSLQGGAKKKC